MLVQRNLIPITLTWPYFPSYYNYSEFDRKKPPLFRKNKINPVPLMQTIYFALLDAICFILADKIFFNNVL